MRKVGALMNKKQKKRRDRVLVALGIFLVMEVLKAREAATHGSLDGSEGGAENDTPEEPAQENLAESGVTV